MLQDCVVRVEISMSVGSAMDLEHPVILSLCSVLWSLHRTPVLKI